MKQLITLSLLALFSVGCEKSNPIQTNATADVAYSEQTMFKATQSTDTQISSTQTVNPEYDSTRHIGMLGMLKFNLGLNNSQMDSIAIFGKTMYDALKEIRTKVHTGQLTKDQARQQVKLVRDAFITSVRTILTAEQVIKFDNWITQFWDMHHDGNMRNGGGMGGNGGGHMGGGMGGNGSGMGGRP